jgi:hypothetical protein
MIMEHSPTPEELVAQIHRANQSVWISLAFTSLVIAGFATAAVVNPACRHLGVLAPGLIVVAFFAWRASFTRRDASELQRQLFELQMPSAGPRRNSASESRAR